MNVLTESLQSYFASFSINKAIMLVMMASGFELTVRDIIMNTIPVIVVALLIIIVLLGAFPMVEFITKKFSAPLQKLGGRFDLDENSVGGMIANLANNIMMFQMMKDMRPKGKILNCAFTVSACFVLGDHLGFVAGQNQQLIVPMMAAKFIGGISAVVLANLLWKAVFSRSLGGAAADAA